MIQRSDVFTQLRRPIHLLALLALIAVCIGFFFLGKWQWDRTQDILNAERAAIAEPAPISELLDEPLKPENFGRTVTAVGTFNGSNQVRVLNRLENGDTNARTGEWIVGELELADGPSIAILRGWVGADSDFTTPTDPVAISGVIQPNEAFYAGAEPLAATVVVIDSKQLEKLWGNKLVDGFIVLQDQDPLEVSDPAPVPPTISTSDVPFPLQNFFYAIQWWVFAAFAVALYIRWILVSARDVVSE
jgi:cytochrome oxidase assembly protein ShyY1